MQARTKQTIVRILDAAARLFAETGYEGARVDRIAEMAGVNKAMLYYHIGDKQSLYARVLHEVFGGTAARMADAIGQAETPVEKIKAYVRSIGRTLEKHPHLFPIMMRELASGGNNLPELVVNDLAAIIGSLSTVVDQGCRQGEFIHIDPLVLHLMVIGGIAFYTASSPIRIRYSKLAEELLTGKIDKSHVDLISEIERTVLNALTQGIADA